MSASLVHVQGLIPALRSAGFPIPDDVHWVEIHAGLDEALTIRYDLFVKRDQLPMLAKVFADLAKEYTDAIIERPDTELPGEPVTEPRT